VVGDGPALRVGDGPALRVGDSVRAR
jgi:hypothetical protein